MEQGKVPGSQSDVERVDVGKDQNQEDLENPGKYHIEVSQSLAEDRYFPGSNHVRVGNLAEDNREETGCLDVLEGLC